MSVDKDIENFQRGVREAAQDVCTLALEHMMVYLNGPNPDPEKVVKIYNAAKAAAQAEPANKIDPNAGLATFNIQLISGAIQQVAAPAEPVELVQEVQPAHPLEIEARPSLTAHLIVNDDLTSLLEEL